MGGFLSFFKRKSRIRVLLLGLDSAGKTTILYHLKHGKATNTVPTIGFNVETIKYKKIEMNIWDVGGQDRLRPLWRHYYSGTSGVVFVIDSSDKSRMDKARDELHLLMHEEELERACVLALANKQDLPGACSPEEVSELMEMDQISHLHQTLPAVAKTGEGINEAMDWLMANMKAF
uniref:ADP-ribosylation factor 6 n=1 Tax=Hirondellea gigas TaxID=1518452 RepID=A0A6A7GAR2_9CRUS